jgi:hypothetical protein
MKAFTWVNGREVFDNGEVKKWRCDDCRWWLDWEEESCRICGAPRDGVRAKAQPVKARVTALKVMTAGC